MRSKTFPTRRYLTCKVARYIVRVKKRGNDILFVYVYVYGELTYINKYIYGVSTPHWPVVHLHTFVDCSTSTYNIRNIHLRIYILYLWKGILTFESWPKCLENCSEWKIFEMYFTEFEFCDFIIDCYRALKAFSKSP